MDDEFDEAVLEVLKRTHQTNRNRTVFLPMFLPQIADRLPTRLTVPPLETYGTNGLLGVCLGSVKRLLQDGLIGTNFMVSKGVVFFIHGIEVESTKQTEVVYFAQSLPH